MDTQIQTRLKTLFDSFESDFQDECLASGLVKAFREETQILSPGQKVDWIPMVLQGSIRVLRDDPSGKEILLYYIQPGESCVMSILAMNRQQESQVRAIATSETQLLLLPVEAFKRWAKDYHSWNEFVLELYTTRFEELIQVVNELAFSRVDQRLAEFLQKRVQIEQSQTILATHQQIADELGTAREVVSRLLKAMEQSGRVKLGRGKIIWLE